MAVNSFARLDGGTVLFLKRSFASIFGGIEP
jgi:hypothetical protein